MAESPACAGCGYVFFESPARHRRPPVRWLAGAAVVVAGGVAAALLLTRDSGPPPPAALPAESAELRLEGELGVMSGAAVRCPGPVGPGRITRCRLVRPDGDSQPMTVTMTRSGALAVDIPYPAQRLDER